MKVQRITAGGAAFQTDDPDTFVRQFARDHGFAFASPGHGERFRLTDDTGAMILAVLPDGRIEPLGRQAAALVLLLTDMTGGQAA